MLWNCDTGLQLTQYSWNNIHTQEINRIVNRSLDGTTYLQVIGSPQRYITVEGMIENSNKMNLLDADAQGNLIKCDYLTGYIYGRIINLDIDNKIRAGMSHFTAKLAKEVVML